ncbi:MAG: hypothetical protein ACRDL7_13060, partial [Gaiellaceae bacterium]
MSVSTMTDAAAFALGDPPPAPDPPLGGLAPGDPPPAPDPFFKPPTPGLRPDPGIANQSPKPLEKVAVRIIFKVPKTNGLLHVPEKVGALFNKMWKADPTIVVYKWLSEDDTISSPDGIPTDEIEFCSTFQFHETKEKGVKYAVVCLTLGMTCALNTFKSQHPDFMTHLRDNSIQFLIDEFNGNETAKIGHLFFIHVVMAHREQTREVLSKALARVAISPEEVVKLDPSQSPMEDDKGNAHEVEIPKFRLYPAPIYHRTQKSTFTTKALEITCTKLDAPLLKELFTRAYAVPREKRINVPGEYIPPGLANLIGT